MTTFFNIARRGVIAGLVGTLAALPLGLAPAQAQDAEATLKVSFFTPPSSDNNKLVRRLQERLTEATDGRLVLDFYEASQMGPAPRQFDLVRTGVADVSIMLIGLAPGRFPLLEMLDYAGVIDEGVSPEVAVPATSAALEMSDAYLSREMAGVKLLNIAVLPNPIIISKDPITSLADLKNKRIRHPGAAHAVMLEKVGAVPTAVQSNEMAEALARGVVDGVLTGYTGVDVFQLQDSATYVLELPSGGMTFIAVMNQDSYDALPADLQDIFDTQFGPANQAEWGAHLAIGEVEARDRLRADLTITQLPEADIAQFREVTAGIREGAAAERDAKGIPGTEFLEQLRKRGESYR
ncbi:TRAP transporter substrate-binding protein DctP [Mesobacterium pallidum]|uniref:TRAP transporter substrate-binding protein DctP n=1 Tax=Mesobacterium pallidum TaxID=2872037 RepID=UPI001EE3186A|nr:TRAP transporter substrate-binding protein DctP [Mesobacterium pallidum]